MKKIFFTFFIILSFSIHAKVIVKQKIIDTFAELEDRIECGDATIPLAEIEAIMSADIVPWRMSVMKGKDWTYPWGLLAHRLKARALQKMGKVPEAYRTLMDGYVYLPKKIPPEKFSREYWKWWLLASKICSRLGRNFDAEWYATKIRKALTTNDIYYFKATAELARIYSRQGRYLKASKLYDELFQHCIYQKTSIWNDYIRLQFNSGNFEKGVELILKGAKINGISPKYIERDYFIRNTCRYWHFFHDIEIFEWYELLGDQLKEQELASQNEVFFAFIINTRNMLKKTYPELFAIPDDDIAALKKRLNIEKTNQLSAVSYKSSVKEKKSNKQKSADKSTFSINPVDNYLQYTNIIIEDNINKILSDAQKTRKYDRGNASSWKNLLEKFSTNQLALVSIDGVSALFFIYSQIGTILCDEYKHVEAEQWLKKTLELKKSTENNIRYTDVLLWFSEIYLSRKMQNLEEAKYYLDWANDLISDNIRQRIEVESQLSGIAIMKGGSENRIKYLQKIVDKYGCTPRQQVYERLARDYYRLGECRNGFEILIEGIKRTPLKIDSGRYNHFFEGLIANKSFHTSKELKKTREIFKTSALRIPVTLKNIRCFVKISSFVQEAWIDNQIKFAEIQENKDFSEENWLFISNTVFNSPSIRSCLLYTEGQVFRDNTNTNFIDWTGWQKGWNMVQNETKSKYVSIDSGIKNLSYKVFVEQLFDNKQRINIKSKKRIYETICGNIKQLNNSVFNSIINFFIDTNNPENIFELHFSRMKMLRNSLAEDPSFKAMVEMYSKLEMSQKSMLKNLLCAKYKNEKNEENKGKWMEFMKQCGIENPPNTL